jgi:bacterioferritin
MKGKPEALEVLNQRLKAELGAILQYTVHGEMCDNWGYLRLAKSIKAQARGEMKHAEALIERILFLDGTPNVSEVPALGIGKDVKQQLLSDLALELAAVVDYNNAIARVSLATAEGSVFDDGSRKLLESILADEEEHVNFLEAQLQIIRDIGLENYLIEQTHEE